MKTMCPSLLALGCSVFLGGMAPSMGQQGPLRGPTAPMDHGRGKSAPSTSLMVTVEGKPATMSLAGLQAMPQRTVTVHNSHAQVDETYVGVALTDVLVKAGAGESSMGKALLRSYVKAEATDKYWVLYSGIEIEGVSHLGDVIVATARDGKALGDSGQFMLVSTEDKKPQRWVRNLSGLTLKKAE